MRLPTFDWPSLRAGARRHVNLYSLALGAILVAAVALRAYHLGDQSLWIDEVDEGTTARSDLGHFLANVRTDYGAAPLDYLAVKVVLTILGRHGTLATRAWAIAMGCLAVWLTYRLARSLFHDRLLCLIAVFMLAFSAFHIYYSQEARFYAFAVVAGTVQLIAFFHALDARTVRSWLLVTLATVVALYTHYFLALLLPVEGIYLLGEYVWRLARRDGSITLGRAAGQLGLGAASQAVGVTALLPWLVYALPAQLQAGYDRLPPLGFDRVHQIFVVLVGLAPLNSVQATNSGQTRMANVVLGLAAIGLVSSLKAGNARVLVPAGAIALAIPLAWTSDQIGRYFWAERQVIFVLVPLYLVAAAGARTLLVAFRWAAERALRHGLLDLTAGDPRQLSVAMVTGLAMGLAGFWAAAYWGPIQQIYANQWITKEDWRGASQFALATSCPDTRFWSYAAAKYSYGIGYYDDRILERGRWLFVLPDGTFDASISDDAARQPIRPDDWIVTNLQYAELATPSGTEDAILQRRGWKPTAFGGVIVYTRGACTTTASSA